MYLDFVKVIKFSASIDVRGMIINDVGLVDRSSLRDFET